jgi:hypothetical protein
MKASILLKFNDFQQQYKPKRIRTSFTLRRINKNDKNVDIKKFLCFNLNLLKCHNTHVFLYCIWDNKSEFIMDNRVDTRNLPLT